MYKSKGVIKMERFLTKKYIKRDSWLALSFAILFFMFGIIDKNLLLPNEGLGLLEHINIWIFLTTNCIIPIALYKLLEILKENIDCNTFQELKDILEKTSKLKLTTVLYEFTTVIGFCFFIGNSLQNAHMINQLPFDYWDSINYTYSYIISRLYKLYLFVYFIPHTLIYVFISIRSVSEILIIKEKDMDEYPIKNYMQLNALCNFGLDTLLILLIPFMLFSSGVYWVHSRLDITTVTTIIAAITCTISLLSMYTLLIHNFYISVIKYKKKHIEQINSELSKIHQYIFRFDEKSSELLEVYIKKEHYLSQCKERINKISKFPLIIKAIFTSLSPFIPAVLKIIFSALKNFF